MARTTLEILQEYSDLGPDDNDLPRRIIRFENYILNKTTRHTEFFGGNIIGYPVVSFADSDVRKWLEEVCLIDDIKQCQEDLYEIYEREHKVNSTLFNISIVWILHILWQMKRTTVNRPEMVSTLVVGMSRHLTAFMKGRFNKYEADPEIALSMFERLDRKNDFKKEGSWVALLRYRTYLFLSEHGAYPDVWQDFNSEDRINKMTSEVNSNLRNTVNLLMSKYTVEKENKSKIERVSKFKTDQDGSQVMKDYVRNTEKLIDDTLDFCSDPPSLIKKDLVEIVDGLYTNTNEKLITNALSYLSDNLYSRRDPWEDMVTRIVMYLTDLSKKNKVDFKNIGNVVTHMMSIIRTSSTKNKDILYIKEKMLELTKASNDITREQKHVSTAAALTIYITIRMLAINYYK